MIVLTCIRPEALQKLRRQGEVTLELLSFQNILAVSRLKDGDIVFLTVENEEDLRRNTTGVAARVERKHIDYIRTGDHRSDEWEIKRARVRLSLVGTGRINQVVRGDVILADVDLFDHLIIG